MSLIEVKVPDIGDFKDVPVIGIEVSPGDTVKAEDPLVTLESDKATMEVPSPAAGVVKEIRLKIGDKVSEGTLVLLMETAEAGAAAPAPAPVPAAPPAAAPPAAAPAPQAARHAGGADIETDMLVLGAGPGGYSAAFRSADLGLKTVLVERYAALGGVCLNVGCIPSKALLHVAAVVEEAAHMADCGVAFAAPKLDLDKLRAHKAKVVSKLTGGLAGMAKARKVDIVRGYGHFLDANHLEVELTKGDGQDKIGEKKVIRFQKCIIAAGSQAVRLPGFPWDDTRMMDSTGALDLRDIPKRCWWSAAASSAWRWLRVRRARLRGDRGRMLDQPDAGCRPDLVDPCSSVWKNAGASAFISRPKSRRIEAEEGPQGLV
jgi:dihydrolipoamide dehydrogenase